MKRLFDLFVSLVALVFLLPALLVIAWLIKIKLGSPIIFSQERPGINGKSFKMIKFRTMRDIRDAAGNLLPDSERITRFGALLRSSSLDELPELWNVIKGEMSLVGPRPLLVQYLPLYNNFQSRRHEVKPGITGWAQVNGRNSLSWDDKFKLDVWYVDNRTFWLDIKILYLTVKKVIVREGITQENHPSMDAFKGSIDNE